MARRGGKAASRRSRQQRRAQRAQQQAIQQQQQRPEQEAAPAPQAPPSPEADEEEQEEAASSAPVDAFEAADAELRASTPPPGARAGAPRKQKSVRARTGDFNLAGGSSRLTERAVAEYHYVGRDLRNIGVLVVVMVVLLAISAIVVNLLGIGV